MTPEEKRQFKDLQNKVAELTKKVDALYSTSNFPAQITNNLKKIGFMLINKNVGYLTGSNNEWDNLFVEFLNRETVITGKPSYYYIRFTANPSNDTLNTNTFIEDGTEVWLLTNGVLPVNSATGDPLLTGVPYYIRDATNTTCKLASSVGGAAINLTTSGSGTHYLNIT